MNQALLRQNIHFMHISHVKSHLKNNYSKKTSSCQEEEEKQQKKWKKEIEKAGKMTLSFISEH